MKDIKVLGIDLAKNVFQIHGTDSCGNCKLRKRLNRIELIEFMGNCLPCVVGIEASGGSHYWARLFKEYGHTVKMMAPQFVKPYVMSNKNDASDARGIAEAVTARIVLFDQSNVLYSLFFAHVQLVGFKFKTADNRYIILYL